MGNGGRDRKASIQVRIVKKPLSGGKDGGKCYPRMKVKVEVGKVTWDPLAGVGVGKHREM